MKTKLMTLLAFTFTFMLTMGTAQAETNPFTILDGSAMQLAQSDSAKCGAGKCGGAKETEAKCGAGKCGGAKESSAKCGAGKCGGAK